MSEPKVILESVISDKDISVEDRGCALIIAPDWYTLAGNEDQCMSVRIHSWDENYKKHEDAKKLIGKKVIVTIEIVD